MIFNRDSGCYTNTVYYSPLYYIQHKFTNENARDVTFFILQPGERRPFLAEWNDMISSYWCS